MDHKDIAELAKLRMENIWLTNTMRHLEVVKDIARGRENDAVTRMNVLAGEVTRLMQQAREYKRTIHKLQQVLDEYGVGKDVAALPDAVVRVLHSE